MRSTKKRGLLWPRCLYFSVTQQALRILLLLNFQPNLFNIMEADIRVLLLRAAHHER